MRKEVGQDDAKAAHVSGNADREVVALKTLRDGVLRGGVLRVGVRVGVLRGVLRVGVRGVLLAFSVRRGGEGESDGCVLEDFHGKDAQVHS
jgi:hypothetical protein